MTVATLCVHDEYLDYLNGRHLGYCRKCGRTMEYHPLGEEKPHDVTEEFGGNNPFPFTFKASDPASAREVRGGDEPLTAYERRAASHSNFAITPEQSRNARERTAARREQEPVTEIPQFPSGTKGNTAKGRFYAAHFDEIRADLERLGPKAVMDKWGMSEAWLYDHFKGMNPNLVRRKGRARLEHVTTATDTEALARAAEQALGLPADSVVVQATPQTAQQVTQQTPGPESLTRIGSEPHGVVRLPQWNEAWNPVVQVEWLRAATTIAVVGMTRGGRKAEVAQ
jgi:hypothetical protein